MARGIKKHQKRLSLCWSPQAQGLPALDRLHPQPVREIRIWKLNLSWNGWTDSNFAFSLKYALNGREVKAIMMQRLIKVDGKVRTDQTYPAGFMDVIGIEKTGENFRLIYDTKGRFTVHRIQAEEAEFKLCKVKRVQLGKGGIPFLVTHDARTIRYPDPAIKVNDTVKVDVATGKISDFVRFDTGVVVMATGGRNMGRVGVVTHRERHDGGFNVVHIKDAIDNTFATRESNVFVIGQDKPWISLPKGKGVKLSIAEERDRRRAHAIAN
ncbi:40S ribosomal protein S4 [Aspergillus wentii]|nr:40S ribosomal protein S4 [Aspergillus wentii]